MHRAHEIAELKVWKDAPIHLATFKKAVRNAWKRHFGCKCQLCGAIMLFDVRNRHHRHYATLDHILARGLGGGNGLDNIQVVCRECNNKKSVEEHRQKLS